MNLLGVLIIALAALVAFSSITHHFKFKVKRTLLILAIFFVGLVVASAYFDFSGIFGPKNIFAKTGASVISDVKDAVFKEDLIKKDTLDSISEGVADKTSEITKGIISLPRSNSIRTKSD